jgi:hypothetical protein
MAFKFGNTAIMAHEANGEVIFSVGEVISDTQMKVLHRFDNLYQAWNAVIERVGEEIFLPLKLEQYL